MIHFTCDGCDRHIDAAHEPRYIFRLEIYAAPESAAESAAAFGSSGDLNGVGEYGASHATDQAADVDTDRDHLAELEDLLEGIDNFSAEPSDEAFPGVSPDEDYRQVRYDLCGDCRKRMLSNPLARLAVSKIDFSDN